MHSFFLARQPIYDSELHCLGYELLYRPHASATHAEMEDPERATARLLVQSLIDVGLSELTGGRDAFVNATEQFFYSGCARALARPDVVFEVPFQALQNNRKLCRLLRGVRKSGCRIAVDDFSFQGDPTSLAELADYLKVRLPSGEEPQERMSKLKALCRLDWKVIGTKIEEYEEYRSLKNAGVSYFQGYFLCRPQIVESRSLPASHLAILKLLEKLSDPEVEIEELERIVTTDIALAHKLLRFVNSPHLGLRKQVRSVRQAIVLAGLQSVKNLLLVLAVARLPNKTTELTLAALSRAKFCELVGQKLFGTRKEAFFTVGLLSLLGAMMDRPMEELLKSMPLAPEIDLALLDFEGELGEVLQWSIAVEQGKWDSVRVSPREEPLIQQAYFESISWVDSLRREF